MTMRVLLDDPWQMIRFLLVGLGNTAFSFGIYSLGIYLGFPYYLASLIALIFGILVSFITQGKLVFRAQLSGRFWMFVVVWGGLYFLNIIIIACFSLAGFNYYWAGLFAIVPVTAVSFVLQKMFVFRKARA